MHLSQTLRKYLGWCPQGSAAPVRKRMMLQPDMRTPTWPRDSVRVKNDLLVDYGSTGTSPLFFIGFVAGITGIVLLLSLIRIAYTLLAGVLLFGLIISVAIIIFYQDVKRATLESTPNALILHKVLLWPVVIPKDTIATAEVRDNVQSVPLWILTLLVIVIPVSSAGVLYGEYLQFVSGEITSLSFFVRLGFDISIVIFFLVIYYHGRIRSHYPKTLVITTTTKKRICIYDENLDEITEALERSG